MESIRRTIAVNAISPEVLARKTFGKAVFIVDVGTPPAAIDRFVKYTSFQAVVDGEGSSTEASKFASTYFSNGAFGGVPAHMFVLKIDFTTEDIAAVFGEILDKSDDMYFFCNETNLTTANILTLAGSIENYTTNWYMGMWEYSAIDAYDDGVATDLASELKALGYEKSVSNFAQLESGNAQYLNGAIAGFLCDVEFTSFKPNSVPAKKSINGIVANSLADSDIGKLIDKYYNYYAETTTLPNNFWYGLNDRNANGNDFIIQKNVDYMSYELTADLAELLKNTPNIGFSPQGFNIVEAQLNTSCQRFVRNGILAVGGVVSQGAETGITYQNGYIIVMPPLADITAAQKIAGTLSVKVKVLPEYSVYSFEITLEVQV